MKRVLIGGAIVALGVGLATFTAYSNNPSRRNPVVFSNNVMLAALWHNYKNNFIEPESGRTLDKQNDNITTSEGQSYSMLRAVYQDDKASFDKSWKFTKSNLQHKDDHLFGYLYGKRRDGSYGIKTDQGGDHTASDADSDIALALALAYQRWQQPSYLAQAKLIISDIWSGEVITINNRPVLSADNLERNAATLVVINPSYFSPYAYKIFAGIDRSHDWKGLTDNTYDVYSASMENHLDKDSTKQLPPDWMLMNRKTGEITAATAGNLTSNFGYDALRVPWRLALDYEWNKDVRAKRVLAQMSFLGSEWRNKQQLKATYSHDGAIINDYESPAMYGATIGYFISEAPNDSETLFTNKLEALYSTDTQSWKKPLSYYDDNWAWFGLALKLHQLPNLGSDLIRSK